MSYRADDDARALRADALIDEIAGLERQRMAQAAAADRLAAARQELADLQGPPPAPKPERAPGLFAHALAFSAAAAVAFIGYTVLT